MIKRHYFLYFEIIKDDSVVYKHFGEFYIKSWFPKNPATILNNKIEAVVRRVNIPYEGIIVVSFNRV